VSGRRHDRLAEQIRSEVASILERRLRDPGLGFVTVTRVELTEDLRLARVRVGVLGGEQERERSLAALARAAGFVRRELGRRLRVRFTPELVFQHDAGIEAADRVARLLEAEPGGPLGGEGDGE
jgi:ribosome-binding factor A